MTWTPSPDETEFYYARLPFDEAQAVFRSDAPETRRTLRVNLGWHGTWFDEKRGCFAVVRSDGPLADWVGERVLLVYDTGASVTAVAAYVYASSAQMTDDEDITVTRRVYLALETPSTTPIEVLICPLTATGAFGDGDAFSQFINQPGDVILGGS